MRFSSVPRNLFTLDRLALREKRRFNTFESTFTQGPRTGILNLIYYRTKFSILTQDYTAISQADFTRM
jgi:hypothetical protein